MLNEITNLNWLAVALGALAYYVLGAAWFTPLLGRAWDRAIGFERAPGHRFAPIYYLAPLVNAVVVAIAIALIITASGAHEVSESIQVGLIVGLAAVAISVTNAVTPNTPRPMLLGAVVGGYHLTGAVLVSVLITAVG